MSHVSFSTIREVVVIPNRNWGGEGLLGCVFGYVPSLLPSIPYLILCVSFGLLHRIPPPASHLMSGKLPPELVVPEDDDQDLFVPADTTPDGYLSDGSHEEHSHHHSHSNGYGGHSHDHGHSH
jgi:hypothetical protein